MLTTRPPHPDDAPALAALMTPGISRWLGHWPVPFTPAMAEARIDAVLASGARAEALTEVLLLDGQVAGWIGGAVQGSRAGFGYWLAEAAQGRGLLRALAPGWVDRLGRALQPQVLWASTQPGNQGSRRVLAACGLRPVRQGWMLTPARGRQEWVETWERAWPG